jgi:hypothetical protein
MKLAPRYQGASQIAIFDLKKEKEEDVEEEEEEENPTIVLHLIVWNDLLTSRPVIISKLQSVLAQLSFPLCHKIPHRLT